MYGSIMLVRNGKKVIIMTPAMLRILQDAMAKLCFHSNRKYIKGVCRQLRESFAFS